MTEIQHTPQTIKIPEKLKNHKHYAKWLAFHLDNRHIIRLIIGELDKHIEQGKTKASIKTIIGVLRYTKTLEIAGSGDYKIDDAFTSLYGNIIKSNFPKYTHLIETRKIRSINHKKTKI